MDHIPWQRTYKPKIYIVLIIKKKIPPSIIIIFIINLSLNTLYMYIMSHDTHIIIVCERRELYALTSFLVVGVFPCQRKEWEWWLWWRWSWRWRHNSLRLLMQGDIIEWQDLNEEQKKYLIQVLQKTYNHTWWYLQLTLKVHTVRRIKHGVQKYTLSLCVLNYTLSTLDGT